MGMGVQDRMGWDRIIMILMTKGVAKVGMMKITEEQRANHSYISHSI